MTNYYDIICIIYVPKVKYSTPKITIVLHINSKNDHKNDCNHNAGPKL